MDFGKLRTCIDFDVSVPCVTELPEGRDHTPECSPEELRAAAHLRYTADAADLEQAQVFIVTVPTPVVKANRFDMIPLVKASTTVGQALKKGDVVSHKFTAYPGATEEVCVSVLESRSDLRL